MIIKVKNYVIEESKTFTYVLKGIEKEDLLILFSCLIGKVRFDYRSNSKSNTLSFTLNSLYEFENIKRHFKKRFSI